MVLRCAYRRGIKATAIKEHDMATYRITDGLGDNSVLVSDEMGYQELMDTLEGLCLDDNWADYETNAEAINVMAKAIIAGEDMEHLTWRCDDYSLLIDQIN